jgi:hypothetical protein
MTGSAITITIGQVSDTHTQLDSYV